MNSRSLTLLVAVAVTTVCLDLNAQSRKPIPVKLVDSNAPKAVAKMDLVELPEGSLKDAVDNLKARLELEKLPPMNIVYSRGADLVQISDLMLRNVTGADALRLICTSADCEMEPIFSEPDTPQGRVNEYVIGYRVYPRALPMDASRSYGAMTPRASSLRTSTSRTGPVDPFASSSRSLKNNRASVFGGTGGGAPASTTAAQAVKTSTVGTRLVSYGSKKPMLLTRVYPLGRITTRAKFPEVEKTMLTTLEVAGHKPSDATLALHEKTNVLVVRASNEVHELVSNLLESLAKNSDHADTGEVANLERKIKALLIEMENVKQVTDMRIQEAETRRRQAENELGELARRLRDTEKSRVLKK